MERPRVRQRLSPAHGGDTIPPMPTLVPGGLSEQDRHADLQDAMNGGKRQGSRVDVHDEEPLLHASGTISVSHSDLSTVLAEVSISCHHILDRGGQR